jgi:hypothetical protein
MSVPLVAHSLHLFRPRKGYERPVFFRSARRTDTPGLPQKGASRSWDGNDKNANARHLAARLAGAMRKGQEKTGNR